MTWNTKFECHIYYFCCQCERTRADQHVRGSKWTECSWSVYSSPECAALCDLLWWAGLTSTQQGEEWGLGWCHGSVSHESRNTLFGQKWKDSAVFQQVLFVRLLSRASSLQDFTRPWFLSGLFSALFDGLSERGTTRSFWCTNLP